MDMHSREKDILDFVDATLRDDEDATKQVASVMQYLHDEFPDNYWVGVYLLKGEELILGPFVGPATEHVRIPVGRGVCGTAVATGANQVVTDVSSLSNYLACNVGTRSEIVVLIREPVSQRILGQIDIDGKRLAQFTAADEKTLARVAARLAAPVAELVRNLS